MLIDRIDSLDAFDALRRDWEAAYAADADAQIFVDWAWLRSWFEIAPYPWHVLAARVAADQPYVAFLPLATRTIRIRSLDVIRELQMGGKPFAPFSGFVCSPPHAEEAMQAFGEHVRRDSRWERFSLAEVMDSRFDLFARHLDGRGIHVHPQEPLSCPYVPLPDSWDDYLQSFMSKKGRFNLRRSMRQLEELDAFHVTSPDTEPVRDQIDTLLALWQERWGAISDASRHQYQHMYGRAHERGGLWLKILWQGECPVAGLAALVDRVKRTTAYYTSGFDARYAKLSPGKAIVGYAIQDAIAEGQHTFDFLVGGHDYKLSFFGSVERFASSALAVRSNVRQRVGGWLLRSRDLLRSARPR